VRRSASWNAGGWRGSSRGASTRWCGAVDAFGRDGEVLDRRVDGRLNGGGAGSSPMLWGMVLRSEKPKLAELRSTNGSRQCSGSTGLEPGGGVAG
jgi:hypothetical protein